MRRARTRVGGTVQGVGFRPYVFRLANELGLAGWVLNDERGVELEVEGRESAVAEFLARLPAEAPPLARVASLDTEPVAVAGERDFRILKSGRGGPAAAAVSADFATCDACLAEVLDPADRRHRYPFTNCTDCGPRFTIVRGVPYDRPLTTMASFTMCPACRREYDDPTDRRFHAQPNACPECGPQVTLVDPSGTPIPVADGEPDALVTAARLLAGGAIIAVKGIGGFHLACLASDEAAVAELRRRKHREEKPFALMAPSLEAARELVELNDAEAELLTGAERPIILARRRPEAAVAAATAPRSRDLGVMLPYSPLQHLLLGDLGRSLVMTSGNVSDEPIAYRDSDALARLASIADAFLLSDRPIGTRTDDSVVRALSPELRSEPLVIRRSRGYVPESLELPEAAARPILACGAELKNTFCIARGDRAWVGPHIGDLKNWETLESFRAGIDHFCELFEVTPQIVAHDLHPDYLSSRHAVSLEGLEPVAVQHHHAHLGACLAEHGLGIGERAVGAIFDGTGLGTDGTVWGGEILVGDLVGFERRGFLLPVPMPGGEAAIREPWRMACAWLAAAHGLPDPPLPAALRGEVTEEEWASVSRIAASGVNSPMTTSAGRLFDAVAALAGVRARVFHEGQAAAELEGLTDPAERSAYPMPRLDGEPATLDARPTIAALAADADAGVPAARIGARFHNALAEATASACAGEAEAAGLSRVVLSGGVFQNRLLLERTAAFLRERGLRVLIPRRLPPNDGGIAYGQAAIAAARSVA